MDISPIRYHGEWWVPAVADRDTSIIALYPEQMMGYEKKYTGTLTYYGNEDSTLELYHIPSNFHSKHYHQNEVMWGKDANGNIFTLFNVMMREHQLSDFTKTKFVVGLILWGEHVLSIEDTCFNRCVVQFPYLRNWAFENRITEKKENHSICYNTELKAKVLMETKNISGACWKLWQGHKTIRTIHDLTITQTTSFEITAINALSIKDYLKQIEEFTQFLSIALYGEQNPSDIHLFRKDKVGDSILLFKKDPSVNPGVFSLIKFDLLKDKLPSMMNIWHSNFDKVAPISSYLIESLRKKNRFNVPDFLIIAQALDGYYKRFANKKKDKDIRKYEDQISLLLEQFMDVDVIRKCKINPIVLKDSRHKYSHLYPDDEKSTAVEGEKLYWLTEKCKILLTCCILNMMGLSNEEINICCNNSPIQNIIKTLSFEMEI